MCVIVDANCFGSVFNPKSKDHKKFAPVFNWLLKGTHGRLVYGGTKYKSEVDFKTSKYRGLLGELERKGRLVPVADEDVDAMAIKVRKIAGDIPDFDDEHIVAIVAVSKCCVVCTGDKRADPYLKRKDLYPKGVKPPKIYRSNRNAKLCCNANVADICH